MKKFRTVALIFAALVVLYIYYNSLRSASETEIKLEIFPTSDEIVNRTINILLYTSFWKDTYWLKGNESGVQNTPELKACPIKNCRLTTNRSALSNITEFDALIFHHAYPWVVDGVEWKIPEHRSSKQLYIFGADEYEKMLLSFRSTSKIQFSFSDLPKKYLTMEK